MPQGVLHGLVTSRGMMPLIGNLKMSYLRQQSGEPGEKNILTERDLCKARRNPGAGRIRKADWQGREAQLTALNTDWGWIPYSFAN